MKNIIIIGNGFDLSHKLKTDYSSFVRDILSRDDGVPELYLCPFPEDTYFDKSIKIKGYNEYFYFKNSLFGSFCQEVIDGNWADLEQFYFDLLLKTDDINNLNKEFSQIKNHLESYLKKINTDIEALSSYSTFFNLFGSGSQDNLIVNFNYTDTLEKLYESNLSNTHVVNIHGALFDDESPIIFGYSADKVQVGSLLDKNDNEYLRNIKKYKYKQNYHSRILVHFLEKSKWTNVYIIGHSCSISDKDVLQSIFNNEYVNTIIPFYYNNYSHYEDTIININRIMGPQGNFNKVLSAEESLRTPQFDDDMETKKMFDDDMASMFVVKASSQPEQPF